MPESRNFIDRYLTFLDDSPTPYHATEKCEQILRKKGFVLSKNLNVPGKIFFKRDTVLIAITIPPNPSKISIVGVHNDSPVLKIKNKINNSLKLKTYGGGLWHTWFDRTLGIAGQVIDKDLKSHLVKIDKPVVYIPSLPPHLDMRDVYKDGFSYNKEKHLVGVCDMEGIESICENEVISHDLSLFDTQRAVRGGMKNEFVYSARQDNLLSTFCAIEAINESTDSINIVAVFDSEEIGSETIDGAKSAYFTKIINELVTIYEIDIDKSIIISCDVAHGYNPNYSEKFDSESRPVLGGGMVIKYSSRYATNNYTSALIKLMMGKFQEFALRNDCLGGGTIGPMLVCNTGIQGVDIGAPILGMHSIKEMSHVDDIYDNYVLFRKFFGQ